MMSLKGSELTQQEVDTIRKLYRAWMDDDDDMFVELPEAPDRLIAEHLVLEMALPFHRVAYAISNDAIEMVVGDGKDLS